jgi:cytochrome c-type biogenesis protein CcmH
MLMLAAAALSQTASEKPNVDVRRVGARLACRCGCTDSVATCAMLECSFSKPAKEKIAQLQAARMSDEDIVQGFVRENGQGIYLSPPNALGWIVPYACAVLGAGMILIVIRKMRKPAVADLGTMPTEDPALAKYKDQIDKDLANLD